MGRRALVVGVEEYDHFSPLKGTKNDSITINKLLSNHENGDSNFDTKHLSGRVSKALLTNNIKELLAGKTTEALFYFSGHGSFDQDTAAGYLATSEAQLENDGYDVSALLSQINKAVASNKIHSVFVILDCCYAGKMGGALGLNSGAAHINEGVTILTSSRDHEVSIEENSMGLFTSILAEGLNGTASDTLGRITAASLYAFIDEALSNWGQRPLFKSNVQEFVVLRNANAKIDKEIVKQLPVWFPDSKSVYALDPSNEPDRDYYADQYKNIEVDKNKEAIYRQLQKCNRAALVVPVGLPADRQNMWDASLYEGGKGCELTQLGRHYRDLAEQGMIR